MAPMSAPVPFSSTVAARSVDGATVRFRLGDDWQQGRTPEIAGDCQFG